MRNPEKGAPIEQDVSQGSASKRGQAGCDTDAHNIESLSCGFKHPSQRKNQGCDNLNRVLSKREVNGGHGAF